VAQRIACGFDRMLWHKKLLLSPQVVSATAQGNEVTLTLDQPLSHEGVLHEFEIAGADNRFTTAEASGKGNQIVVRSAVEHPAAIRYAWKNNPDHADVYGKNSLPMSPFCITID
jgi:sialate O-acetylesterase